MIDDLRYERKWVFDNVDPITLLSNLINSDLHFQEQYEQRYVNSIYYDDRSLKSARDNLDGNLNRKKYRVRWYGENADIFRKPILECKIRYNFYGKKEYFQIKNFNNKIFNEKNLSALSQDINKIIQYKNLLPVSSTHYKRIYLISSNSLIRATLDYNIRYKKIMDHIEDFYISSQDTVLEIKYPTNLDSYLRGQLKSITRFSKNSKYLNSLLNSNFN